MTNGTIDKAQLDLLKKAPVDEKLDYLMDCAYETNKTLARVPEQTKQAIQKQRSADFKRIASICAVIALVVSLLTPYVLAIFH